MFHWRCFLVCAVTHENTHPWLLILRLCLHQACSVSQFEHRTQNHTSSRFFRIAWPLNRIDMEQRVRNASSRAFQILYGRTNKNTDRHRFRCNTNITSAYYYYLIFLSLLPRGIMQLCWNLRTYFATSSSTLLQYATISNVDWTNIDWIFHETFTKMYVSSKVVSRRWCHAQKSTPSLVTGAASGTFCRAGAAGASARLGARAEPGFWRKAVRNCHQSPVRITWRTL